MKPSEIIPVVYEEIRSFGADLASLDLIHNSPKPREHYRAGQQVVLLHNESPR